MFDRGPYCREDPGNPRLVIGAKDRLPLRTDDPLLDNRGDSPAWLHGVGMSGSAAEAFATILQIKFPYKSSRGLAPSSFSSKSFS